MSDERYFVDVWSTPQGDVVLRWPRRITERELPFVIEWIELIQRKIDDDLRWRESVASLEAAMNANIENALKRAMGVSE